MTALPTLADPTPAIIVDLRTATARQHEALESELALLDEPLSRERFVAALCGFLGFHQVWEPAIAATLGDAAGMAWRSRIELLIQDLRALGCADDSIAAIRPCTDAAALVASPAHAWGSLYVMEGSTLGGQVISRRLRDVPWVPEHGLRYFDPYGQHTGARWKETRAQLSAAGEQHDPAAISTAAVATFELLRHWVATPTFAVSPA
ncbi:biliverdin-producing heme oxygenase [soil metagenome]